MSSVRFPEFRGLDQSGGEIPVGFSPNAQNVDTREGTLKRCRGYSRFIARELPSEIITLMKFHSRSGAAYEDILLAATKTAVYACKNGRWEQIASGRTSGGYTYLNYQVEGRDAIFMANGTDYPLKWDGTTATELATVPKFSDIALHYERVWGCGVSGQPDRVYYSAAFSPEDFSTQGQAGTIDIPTFDGGSVVAVGAYFNDVAVFKKENVYRIYGTYPGSYEVSPVYSIVGPVAGCSVASSAERVYFLCREGVCVYNGLKAVPFHSDKLKALLSRINYGAAANTARGVYFSGRYILALPIDGSEENNAVLEWEEARGVFSLKVGAHITSFVEVGGKLLLSDGRAVYEWESGDAFGDTPILARWETPPSDLGSLSEKKTVRSMYAALTGKLKIRVAGDISRYSRTASGAGRAERIRLRGAGRRLSFVFENTEGGDFTLTPPELIVESEGE